MREQSKLTIHHIKDMLTENPSIVDLKRQISYMRDELTQHAE